MTKKQGLVFAASSALVATVVGCSPDDGGGTTSPSVVDGVTGGASDSGSQGGGTGGVADTGGVPDTGGTSGVGGTMSGTNDVPVTGGHSATGGASDMGGAAPGTGGISPASGGADGEGGALNTGGAAGGVGGLLETGGTSAGGIGPATGGAAGFGGDGLGGTPPIDPEASSAINACMDLLPWGASDMSEEERAPIIAAIINVCAEFAPPGAEWQTYCQMFLVGAINAESSYQVNAGSVGAGDDPTIGLLQIRFSSTVRDFADFGPVDAMERIGCDFGTVTSTDSYATKGEMMLDVTCNIALGTWYYFIFGSGNGGSDVVWVYEYCRGGGSTGSLHIGMACHLMGAEAAHSSIEGADSYYDTIKGWFDPCVTYSGTHPFELPIEPDRAKYCG